MHRLVEVARQAEAAGAAYVTVPEHVLVGPNASAQDPWSDWEPHHVDLPWPEPLLTLAAMSAATTRIGLVSAVVIAPLRPAGLLAKMGATLHALSRGLRWGSWWGCVLSPHRVAPIFESRAPVIAPRA
jgi:alkanesulfonate monooxygenase SsuD/methylene tetrahydromethanopterin reductase-like flavin-dependent oxidoreductase (luciferase family)